MSRVRRKKRGARLSVNPLERRELLSANVVNGTLYVEAGDLDDIVRVDLQNSTLVVRENHELYRFDASTVRRIVVLTKAGDDRITIDPEITIPVAVRAGAGDDLIRGGSGRDRLYGGSGDDRIYGRRGDDLLFGQAGDDDLYGQAGDDSLYGHRGDDELYGGRGHDRLRGGRDLDDYMGYERHDDVPARELREYREHDHEYDHDDDDDISPKDGGFRELEYKAYLTGADGVFAKVEYEQTNKYGPMKAKFEVEVAGANPGDVFDVYVDGQLVGQVTVGPRGKGKLEFATHPYEPEYQPFPDNFPTITDGTTVQVGTMEGVLRIWPS